MIGCNFLLQISEALCEAKENSDIFGGISIVFAGDFAQLPPVGQRGLHRKSITHMVGTVQGQNSLFGKLLWLSVSTVVILTAIMRQQGSKNSPFVDLLSRLRRGTCTKEDFETLNMRLLSNVCPDWKTAEWLDAPVIVPTNEVKDAINVRATLAYAKHVGKPVYWYECLDKHRASRQNPVSAWYAYNNQSEL
ncbi:hypothetical protein C8R48DRAFT_802604 [Suillus tomentosus]|nr:hypothetical protein C8R48DRAFT_802604 [Suillus tomentosus]